MSVLLLISEIIFQHDLYSRGDLTHNSASEGVFGRICLQFTSHRRIIIIYPRIEAFDLEDGSEHVNGHQYWVSLKEPGTKGRTLYWYMAEPGTRDIIVFTGQIGRD